MIIHCARANETLEVEQVRTWEREPNQVTSTSDTDKTDDKNIDYEADTRM